MKTEYIFPIVLIILDFGAAVVYLWKKEPRMGIYWLSAAVLNICVLMGG